MEEESQRFDPRMQLKVLRSMIPDYKRYLVPSKIVPDLYPHILDEDLRRQIVEKERHSREEAVDLLMKAVLAKKEHGLSVFMDVLRSSNDNRWDRFLNPLDHLSLAPCDGQPSVSSESCREVVNQYFSFIIGCVQGDIIRHISQGELETVLIGLVSFEVIDTDDMEMILGMTRHDGLVQLFTVLPRYTSDWPLKFFQALEKAKPGMLPKIDPCGESPYIDGDKKAMLHGVKETSGCAPAPNGASASRDETTPKKLRLSREEDVSASDEIMDLLALDSGEDISMDVDDSELLSDTDNDDECEFSDDEEKEDADTEKEAPAPRLSMREYQYELAAPAVANRNTIICAPTGSGKTRVALYIVQKHLALLPEDVSREQKVVFLARTVPLVSQQFKIFTKYLRSYRSVLVHGETEDRENLHLMLEDYDILVMTPKILENHLTPDKIPSLSAFSLIIFDECHHTRKGEPYNSVMKKYLQSKKDGERNLPQIVGLTASIGVEKASTEAKAKESIISIMANLDVKEITVVKDHIEELEMTVPKPDEKLKELIPRDGDDISSSINQNMKAVEELLDRQLPRQDMDREFLSIYDLLRKRPAQRNSQKYGQWAVKLCTAARKVHIPDLPLSELPEHVIEGRRLVSQNVQLLAETLIAYSEALDVHELTRPVDVLEHLKKKLEPRHPADSPQCTKLESRLTKIFADLQKKLTRLSAGKNPNLNQLSEVIIEKLDGQWEASRVMVFVRTRATCQALCDWLNSDHVNRELQQLKAAPFTGSAAHQDQGGMTQHEQSGVIEKFRAGDVKLLVCTTVGQEGMDIPDCNLVIRYNHVGNEVTTVQTRGRCRKAGGLCMLLAMPAVTRKERINGQRVKIMQRAIDSVNKMHKKEVQNQVLRAQHVAMKKDEMKKAGMRLKKSKLKKENFSMECTRCRKVRVLGSQIRTIDKSHHVIIGNDLLDKGHVSIKRRTKPQSVDNVQFTGEIICNLCPVTRQNMLGTTLKYTQYQEVEFLTIKAQSWVVLNSAGEVEHCGKWKWKDVRYAIPELTARDISTHLGQPVDIALEEEGAVGGVSD